MAEPGPGEVTELLLAWNEGRTEAREQLIPHVYRELRRRASRALAEERRENSLQPTALVHEVYEKLVDQRRVKWRDRAHFYAVAALLMRRILVDHARRRRALRRGAGVRPLSLAGMPGTGDEPGLTARAEVEVLAVDEAITELAALDPGQARIVELRFFGGLSVLETAEVVGMSRATVHREWAMARAWLRQRLAAAEAS